MNLIVIEGRLAKDPDTRYYNNDFTVCNFDVAVSRSRKEKDGKKETDYFKCSAFGKQAETIEKYFKKGNVINVIGKMQNKKYIDKDGNKRDGWTVQVSEFNFGLTNKAGTVNESSEQIQNEYEPIESVTDDDMPF